LNSEVTEATEGLEAAEILNSEVTEATEKTFYDELRGHGSHGEDVLR
jgi:hypothetical protein